MAEIKGIDVSANQGNINWKTVANYGMGFAILRITEKGNVIDPTFERHNIAMLLLSGRLKQRQI